MPRTPVKRRVRHDACMRLRPLASSGRPLPISQRISRAPWSRSCSRGAENNWRRPANALRPAPARMNDPWGASCHIGQVTYAGRLRLTALEPSLRKRLRAFATTAV